MKPLILMLTLTTLAAPGAFANSTSKPLTEPPPAGETKPDHGDHQGKTNTGDGCSEDCKGTADRAHRADSENQQTKDIPRQRRNWKGPNTISRFMGTRRLWD